VLTVTADPNIFISDLVFGGRPLQLLDAARAGVAALAISDELLDEILRVLREKFRWSATMLDEAVELVGGFARRVRPTEPIDAIAGDPDDNRVLECAVAAGSQFIVSGDSDLLDLGAFRDIRILRVAAFLRRIQP